VPRLIVPLLENLDRGRFDVHAYLVARAVHHPLRRRVEASTTLRDLAGASTGAIVQQIRADAIDILIDAAGHTEHARGDVFAQRPAALQVNYLGHAGTLGAPYYDAIVTDAYATPPALQAHFSEPFLYLPCCYFPCDVSSPLAPIASRAHYGLTDGAFVLMSQAAAYKLIPPVFDAWLRMLRAVPDAVLWLRPMAAPAPANLHARARAHGVDPARIRFAPEEALPHYRARFRLADLYLDTHPFGSHTTVSDALWAGLPVLTLAGRSMAARASASQVRAAGLPELVTGSLEAYEALACSLAADRAALAALTARLRGECRAAPLFDRARYLRDFAQGLLDLWSRHPAGNAPGGA
jgi:predicted O-linked N-acetylglucosamine transferase (SPINDLY family)